MKIRLSLLFLILFQFTSAQTDTAKSNTSFSGYVETYYSYDFNKPDNHERPSFFYNYKRHNEFNVNLAFIKAAYTTKNIRGNVALMTGTYAQYNLASEQELLRNIYEANAGVKLSEKKNLWIDAGIFSSHIGFESAIGKDCNTVTRCILAENTPYYESGIKISYTSSSGKWFLSGLVLNGWQRIKRVDDNNTIAGGTQITFKPSDKITLNYSTFIGNDKPDSVKQMRYYHNLYALMQVSKKINLTLGFDYGKEERINSEGNYNNLYSPVVILKYLITDRFSLAARGEYYSDEHGVLIYTGTKNGFKTFSASLNFDYLPASNVLFRIEARMLNSKDKIFPYKDDFKSSDTFITSSLSISL